MSITINSRLKEACRHETQPQAPLGSLELMPSNEMEAWVLLASGMSGAAVHKLKCRVCAVVALPDQASQPQGR